MPAPGGTTLTRSARLIVPLLTWRLALALVVLGANLLLPPLFNLRAYQRNFHWPEGAPVSLATLFRTWDGEHYLFLATEGYRPGAESNRFYPLWPLCIRALQPLFGALGSALALAAAFSTAALVLLHDLVARTRGASIADTSVLLLLAFPGALFFGFPYSESLFLFLLVATFWLLERDQHRWAALPAVLLPLTRAVGVFVLLPVAFTLWQRKARGAAWLAAAAPLLGFGLYLLVMQWLAGDAFAGFSAQQVMVSRPSVAKIFDVMGFLHAWTLPVRLHGFFDSWIDRAAFLWTMATLLPLARRDRAGLLLVLPLALVPATSTALMSYTRYAAVLFPSFVATAAWLDGERKAAYRALVAGALFALQLLLLIRHSNFIWAG